MRNPALIPITYSAAYTLVPTYECFNRCDYCNFRAEPGQSPWLSLAEAALRLEKLRGQGVCEILLLSGEVHPHSQRRAAWEDRLVELAALALDLGFLPHTNAGPLGRAAMARLQRVNVSLGLMLEQMTPRLQHTVHRQALSKDPATRLAQLRQAGELGIPFTTGMLVGIGETLAERRETLRAIAQCQAIYGHIQEVIIQPYRPGTRERSPHAGVSEAEFIEVVAIARDLLPASITLQIPPNLTSDFTTGLLPCLEAGARDLGGIVPLDEVNPDYGHVPLTTLRHQLASHGYQLQPRLPVYPQYRDWLSPRLQAACATWESKLPETCRA